MSSFPDGGTLMIASSLPDEGKSTVAANLAAVLAQADKDVVLISADMRKPRMHELFGVSSDRGLSSLLAGAVSPLTCLVASEHPRLVLCPAGPVPSNPAELLQSERMLELVKTLRRTADFVVFDCPPVLAVSDSLGLVTMADAVIFVVDSRSTNRLAVREAAYRLQQVGTRILGGVLNKLDRSPGGYGYGYGYGYGPTPAPGFHSAMMRRQSRRRRPSLWGGSEGGPSSAPRSGGLESRKGSRRLPILDEAVAAERSPRTRG